MHETERESSLIDVKAAAINADAAEIGRLASEREVSARKILAMRLDEDGSERRTKLERELELAELIGREVIVIREAAQRIQAHAQEMRGAARITSLI
jgi:hypothetical protein